MSEQSKISEYFEELKAKTIRYTPKVTEEIQKHIFELNIGAKRVCNKVNDSWIVDEDCKKAILLYMNMMQTTVISSALTSYFNNEHLVEFSENHNILTKMPFQAGFHHEMKWFDKIPLKTSGWKHEDFEKAGFRAVPGAIVRYGSYIGKNVVLMPSFVNIGAYVGNGTMIDTWATVGSCAQIGENCHISGGTGIGGVLEPLQANPVIIGNNCFIGARSEIAEGVIVEDGAVIGMGVFIGKSTKIVNRETGAVTFGVVPKNSVVVAGSLPSSGGVNLYAAVIVKQVDDKTRSKTSINELLRS
jgi:2,3,4,5-tetrahydropyridine-2-carboxylate N-succinyltransferase